MIIPSVYHHFFYLTLVTVFSVVAFVRYSWLDANNARPSNNVISGLDVVIMIFMVIFVGFRDPYSLVFGDTLGYTLSYNRFYGNGFHLDLQIENPLFSNLLLYMSSSRYSVTMFYTLMAFIYFGGIWYACKKLFPKDSLSAFIVYLAAFSTYSYSINGLKAGAAASLFLMSLVFNEKEGSLNKLLCCVLLLCSMGFHHAMRVPVAALVFCKIIKKPQFYALLWIICFMIAAANISYFQEYFTSIGEDINDNKIIGYLSGESTMVSRLGIGGFRIDFVLYSVIPIIFGWFMIFYKNIKSNNYVFILNLYTAINAIWLLCINAWFTNRIAYLSWLMYPIVLIYPFLNSTWGKEHYNVFKIVAYGHLAFTLFMNVVYYS